MKVYSVGNPEGLKIESAGEKEVFFFPLKKGEGYPNKKGGDFFILLLIESGTGIHTIDFEEFEVGTRQFHFIQPHQIHEYKFNNIDGYGLMVHRRFFELFSAGFHFALPLYMNLPVMNLGDIEFDYLKTEFEAIGREITRKKMFRDLIIARFFVIAFSISRISKHYFADLPITSANTKIYDFLKLLDLYFLSRRGVAFYAEKLNITTNYMNTLCKRYFRSTATKVIDDRIILEAKRLLTSGISVKETANALNFQDTSYFSRFFKHHTKSTPTEFVALYKHD